MRFMFQATHLDHPSWQIFGWEKYIDDYSIWTGEERVTWPEARIPGTMTKKTWPEPWERTISTVHTFSGLFLIPILSYNTPCMITKFGFGKSLLLFSSVPIDVMFPPMYWESSYALGRQSTSDGFQTACQVRICSPMGTCLFHFNDAP